ncbi:MAG: PIG-L family deacetylase, partial [Pyrinomonadaceae bacterium]
MELGNEHDLATVGQTILSTLYILFEFFILDSMPEVDILAVFAHPDDLELTVGGTMLRMKSLGYRTGGLDVTRGEMGTRGTVEGRAKEAADAASILKLDVRENLGLADGHVFVDDPSRTGIVRTFRRLKPKVILTHQLDDPHPDHDHIARLVREAARLSSMRNYDPESGADVIPVPKVAHNIFSRNDRPSFVVDVSAFLEDKMAAIRVDGVRMGIASFMAFPPRGVEQKIQRG